MFTKLDSQSLCIYLELLSIKCVRKSIPLHKEHCLVDVYGMKIIESGEMATKQPNAGLFVGLNKGHIVTKKELAPRPSVRKGVS